MQKTFIEHALCVIHYSKHLPSFYSLNPHNNLLKLSSPFCRSVKVNQLAQGRVTVERELELEPMKSGSQHKSNVQSL